MAVPVDVAMSKPVCAPDLILLTCPNLELILPFTGSDETLIPFIIAKFFIDIRKIFAKGRFESGKIKIIYNR